jgi:L-methionine (R)-S-oxide reductase
MPIATADLLRELESDATTLAPETLMQRICERLAQLPNFNWVGFYMLAEEGGEKVLHLGPFVGAPTPHTRIPLNQGICGAAVSQGKTIVVDDVNSDPRYLACSLETKAEIVAPIRVRGEIVGEIDIDSHTHAAFGPRERELVERCAELVGRALEKP